MNFISKIPRSLLIALLTTISFVFVFVLLSSTVQLRSPFSKLSILLGLFLNLLPSAVCAGVAWYVMHKTHKNAWAIGIITGFAIIGLFEALWGLTGPIFGYIALFPIAWGLLIANSRIFANDKNTILKFCILFVFCVVLWRAGDMFLRMTFYMHASMMH